uniref:Uncharacterized protein n=1 Tax=Oryza nivara TaxID=4536 RepID=A0A0E0GF93_ORYNI
MNTRATRRRRRILDKRPKELEQQADRNRGTSETTYMAFFWVSIAHRCNEMRKEITNEFRDVHTD